MLIFWYKTVKIEGIYVSALNTKSIYDGNQQRITMLGTKRVKINMNQCIEHKYWVY